MTDLQAMLHKVNPYVPLYKQAYEILHDKPPDEQANISAWIIVEPNTDHHRYNMPSVDEVVVVIPGSGEEVT